jgi:signal transduction histidine kinase/DNA-binding response OmpR family regulator
MRDQEPSSEQSANLFRWKFRHQLMAMFSAAVLCLASVGAVMTSWEASEAMQRNLLHQGAQVTTGFANQSVLALIYGSADNATDMAKMALGFPGVIHVAVYYPNGDTLLEMGDSTDWRPLHPDTTHPTQLASESVSVAKETNQAWHFLAPVYAPGTNEGDASIAAPKVIGYAHVALTKDVLHALRRDIFIRNIGSSFLAAAVLLLFVPWLASRITRPLNELATLMRKAEQGETALRVRPSGALEVRNMGRVFNLMMETLEQRSQRLDSQNRDLLEQIHEREEAERELRVFRDHLQDLVDEQTRDLIEARDAALAGERAMSTFLANMSHEIRTPLTAILGFSGSLLDPAQSLKHRTESIERIVSNGTHLLKIINDILDLSKIAAQQIMIESLPVAPIEVLAEVCAMAEFQAREKRIGFNVDYVIPLPSRIQSDPLRLKQIFINLISNAIKFTEQGEVNVRVSCDVAQEVMYFEITDTGIGISPEQQANLFNPFTQADASTTRKYGGTGLGLHISKYFAARLGGDITVSSMQDLGSRFTLSVATGDLQDVELITQSTAVPGAVKTQKNMLEANTRKQLSGHILLAEDNLDNQRLISIYIGKTGATFTLAENGNQALELALSNHYDLILMDMQMPVMDGLEAVQLLRQAGYRGAIIAITANTMREDEERYRSAGCDGFISKPIDIPRFYATLAEYLPEQSLQVPAASVVPKEGQFADLVELFVGRLPALRDEIDQASSKRDWTRLLDLVHDLKGMGSSFGYPQLTKLAADIQIKLKEQAYESVAHIIMLLDSAIERVVLGYRK